MHNASWYIAPSYNNHHLKSEYALLLVMLYPKHSTVQINSCLKGASDIKLYFSIVYSKLVISLVSAVRSTKGAKLLLYCL